MATTPITQLINTSITISGYSGYSGISGYSGTPGPTNSLNATNDTATTTLYPVMVGAAASNETPKVTTSKLSFNASIGSMSVVGNIQTSANMVWANSSNTAKVYQFYNSATNSLDTVFL